MPLIKAVVDPDLVQITLEENGETLGFYDIDCNLRIRGVRIFQGYLNIFDRYRGRGYKYLLVESAVKELTSLAKFHGSIRHEVKLTTEEARSKLKHVFENRGYIPTEESEHILFRNYN